MRKIILVLVAVSLAVSQVSAQPYPKNEVAVSYGVLSNSMWLNIFESLIVIVSTLGTVSYSTSEETGSFSAEYMHNLSPMVGVGAVGCFSSSKSELSILNNKEGTAHVNFYTLMPGAKFNWMHRKSFGLYSKLAVGATLRTEKQDCNGADDVRDSSVLFNFQCSLLGLEGGSQHVHAFAEFGVGEQGMALAGIRYKW